MVILQDSPAQTVMCVFIGVIDLPRKQFSCLDVTPTSQHHIHALCQPRGYMSLLPHEWCNDRKSHVCDVLYNLIFPHLGLRSKPCKSLFLCDVGLMLRKRELEFNLDCLAPIPAFRMILNSWCSGAISMFEVQYPCFIMDHFEQEAGHHYKEYRYRHWSYVQICFRFRMLCKVYPSTATWSFLCCKQIRCNCFRRKQFPCVDDTLTI
jgi:hypothetical protein